MFNYNRMLYMRITLNFKDSVYLFYKDEIFSELKRRNELKQS